MKSLLNFIKLYRLPILSGLLVGTSYVPFPPWAIFFGYVPLWIFLADPKRSLKEIWWGSWLTQFVLTLVGFNWVAHLVKEFAFMGLSPSLDPLLWFGAGIALLVFASCIHLYIPLAASSITLLLHKRHLPWSVYFVLQALALSLAERVWPSIFPWHLGYPLLWAKIPIYQLADLVGFEGLSTYVLLNNALIAWIIHSYLQNKKWQALQKWGPALLVLIFIGLNYWGWQKEQIWSISDTSTAAANSLQVSMVQGNIGNSEKIYAEKGTGYQNYIIEKFINLSRTELSEHPETEILIWPESAFPDYLDPRFLNGKNQQLLKQTLLELHRTLITGAYSKDIDYHHPGGPSRMYNSFFAFDSTGQILAPAYHKSHLVAFSEFFPGSDWFPFLLQLPFVSNFGRGTGPKVMNVTSSQGRQIRVGPQICYEGLYPEFSRKLATDGAEILINLTNDSWFGSWAEPYQHMTMTLGRAIETRIPLIRSTNTGISTVILADGKILQQSPLEKEWTGHFDILIPNKKNKEPNFKDPTFKETTFFVRWGHFDWIIILFAFLTLTLVFGIKEGRNND